MVLLENRHAGFTQGALHFSPGCDFVFQRGGKEAVPSFQVTLDTGLLTPAFSSH